MIIFRIIVIKNDKKNIFIKRVPNIHHPIYSIISIKSKKIINFTNF